MIWKDTAAAAATGRAELNAEGVGATKSVAAATKSLGATTESLGATESHGMPMTANLARAGIQVAGPMLHGRMVTGMAMNS